ncbi:LxmA leader domain family RiPP [Streptomyces sp. NPDC054904]|uniref:LxmA leader domain family RiPP n=1 Tax=unclassified Streptomyces TaxID=2593676 RepID=UPI0024820901|nr:MULTISPECIES: LxmA leader domain family RiPP [unclassified Streptomyces]MDA5283863.1 LxmA leader domain family RiPP [Streptomyces sp. Isolate_45]MDX2390001.1 LxmA leader domain family RiPP [Streptomyces sp. DK15]
MQKIENVSIMELVGGFEAYADAAELNFEASADAPAITPTLTTIAYTKASVAATAASVKWGC